MNGKGILLCAPLSRPKGLTRSFYGQLDGRLYLFVFSDNFPHLTDDLVENKDDKH